LLSSSDHDMLWAGTMDTVRTWARVTSTCTDSLWHAFIRERVRAVCKNRNIPVAQLKRYQHITTMICKALACSMACTNANCSVQVAANGALQKDMHEFHADRDHAMCNIQNRSILAVQLTQLRKLSNKDFQGTGVLKSSQSCQVLQCKVAARHWRCLAEIVSFSGSCSRCLVLSPLPCPTLPK
jgi:hypothetical protein